MATANDIITKALKRLHAIPEAQPASAYQQSRSLDELISLLNELPGHGIGGALYEQALTSTGVTVKEPTRYICNLSAAVTVTLPAQPYDGFRVQIVDAGNNFATYPVTVARNGRLIAGSAANATLNTSGTNTTYFYRGDLGDWKVEAAITNGASAIPYPSEFDAALGALLAVRLLPEFGDGGRDNSGVYEEADSGLSRMQARYGQRRRASMDGGLLNMPSQNYGRANYHTRTSAR